MNPGHPFLVVAMLVVLCACSDRSAAPAAPVPSSPATQAPAVSRANPASENCIQQGGQLRIEKTPRGDEYGVCIFEDNHQCEEWALLRGECPAGGRRITGYATEAGRYCAITGGTYTVTAGDDAATEKGTCQLPGGKQCDADAYFRGECTRNR
ncbi:MAG TPA: DUF333 domain-containing protein [Povalibacter sp.]|uniref:putative hemolysin n=1 Tax=Povalibacter sp. TaxID=1962978 RepID=UPI002D1146A3|nr:DUF333 domain-containing protein [Povalibacter sp.]HMN46515.1 DUF333 domain-containing protein [Povalibacter sp.]